jgi:hypothetical protein
MRRPFAGIIALVCWFGLTLQFVLILTSDANQSLSVAERIIRFFSFFTILTNTIVAITTTVIAFFPNNKFFSKASTQAAVASYITIVGLVYSLALRSVWDPQGWQAVADHTLHDVVPVMFVVYWLISAPKSGIAWIDPIKWLVYPVIYIVYSLARGAIVNWYPYWFINVGEVGYQTALTNTAFIMVAFIVIGFIFVAIARLLARREIPAPAIS